MKPTNTSQHELLQTLFAPRSVAVIGISDDPDNVGHQAFRNLLEHDFAGVLHAVDLEARRVLNHPVQRSVLDIPGPVDLAVIAVPARAVAQVAQECARKGVAGLVVLSAGFRERGEEGERRERELRRVLDDSGMRLVGPNCMGILNTHPDVRLHATFAPRQVQPGTTAVLSQSGGMGLAFLDALRRRRIGVARFASLGNQLDVSARDLIEAWGQEATIRQILVYLEDIKDPESFERAARGAAIRKPILLLKSGRTQAGARSAARHTAAATQSDAAIDALATRCGILRLPSVPALMDAALALDRRPPFTGDRIAIVTNSGGPAILAADALHDAGFRPARLEEPTVRRLREFLHPEAEATNPLDILGSTPPRDLARAAAIVLDDPGVDAAIVIGVPLEEDSQVAEALAACNSSGKPCAVVLFGRTTEDPSFAKLLESGAAAYTYPEAAVAALAALSDAATARSRRVA